MERSREIQLSSKSPSRLATALGLAAGISATVLVTQEAYAKWKEKIAIGLKKPGQVAIFDYEEGQTAISPQFITINGAAGGSVSTEFGHDSLYVGTKKNDILTRLDSKTFQELASQGVTNPHDIDIQDDGNIAMSSSIGDKAIFLDPALNQIIQEVTVGENPLDIKHVGDKTFVLILKLDSTTELIQISKVGVTQYEVTKKVSLFDNSNQGSKSMDIKNNLIYLGSADNLGNDTIRIFDPATLTEIPGSPYELPYEPGKWINTDHIISRPNSNQIWTYGIGTTTMISIFDVETKQIIKQISFPAQVIGALNRASFSPDGKRFYLVVDDGSAAQNDVVAVFEVQENGDIAFAGTLNLPKNSAPKDISVDLDTDSDQITNSLDNCPGIANLDQGDFDNDGIGNYCDPTEAGYSQSIALPEGVNSEGLKVNLEDGSAQKNVTVEKDGNGVKITLGEQTDIIVVRTNPAIPVTVNVEPDMDLFFDVGDGYIGLTKGDGNQETVGVSKDNFVPGHEQGASLALEGTSLKLDTGAKPVVNPEPQPEQEIDAGSTETSTEEADAGTSDDSGETGAETSEDIYSSEADAGSSEPDASETASETSTADTADTANPSDTQTQDNGNPPEETSQNENDDGLPIPNETSEDAKIGPDTADTGSINDKSDTINGTKPEITSPPEDNGCSVVLRNSAPKDIKALLIAFGISIAGVIGLRKRKKELER